MHRADPSSPTGRAVSTKALRLTALALLLTLYPTPGSASPDVHRTEIRDGGLVANLWTPPGEGPFPGVLLLGGSGGGIGWQDAVGEVLAGYGFMSLALAYFGLEGLPDTLERIPLEYVEHGLTFFRLQPLVDRERVGVVGVSKGGELALLLGSLRPELRSVVAFVPSGLVWQSVAPNFPRTPSWSFRGAEVPYVPYGSVESPRSIADFYVAGMEQASPETIAAATIPVERINGPVLLLSGRADNLWPSTRFCEMVVERLESNDFSHPVAHRAYDDAGHLISRVREDDVTHRGGTVEGNRAAQLDARDRMIAFLKQTLAPSR